MHAKQCKSPTMFISWILCSKRKKCRVKRAADARNEVPLTAQRPHTSGRSLRASTNAVQDHETAPNPQATSERGPCPWAAPSTEDEVILEVHLEIGTSRGLKGGPSRGLGPKGLPGAQCREAGRYHARAPAVGLNTANRPSISRTSGLGRLVAALAPMR